MAYWLMKSEPDDCSIDDLLAATDRTESWTGVRNYQARNFMRDNMQVGDEALFYHSSCPQPGIAGLARIASLPYPDPTQFDKRSKYFDARSDRANPRWLTIDVQATAKCALVPLKALREHEALRDMLILRRGNRLSITPVEPAHWQFITGKLLQQVVRADQ